MVVTYVHVLQEIVFFVIVTDFLKNTMGDKGEYLM
jgi:hypothetical protein